MPLYFYKNGMPIPIGMPNDHSIPGMGNGLLPYHGLDFKRKTRGSVEELEKISNFKNIFFFYYPKTFNKANLNIWRKGSIKALYLDKTNNGSYMRGSQIFITRNNFFDSLFTIG